MKKISKKFMTFESYKRSGEQIENIQDLLENWCSSESCNSLLGCNPEDVSYPDGEEDEDGAYNVWVTVTVDEENYNRIALEIEEDYKNFVKEFEQFATTNNCTYQVLTNDNDKEITFELTFFV